MLDLRGWLDAGYAMLIDGLDGSMRQLLDQLCESDDDDELERAFASLRSEIDYRRAESERVEREQRRHRGGPTHVRRVRDGELDAAVDAWSALRDAHRSGDDD